MPNSGVSRGVSEEIAVTWFLCSFLIFKKFWEWQPSEKTKKSCIWQGMKKCKIPGIKDAVQEDTHVVLRIFWLTAFATFIYIGVTWGWISYQEFHINASQIETEAKEKQTSEAPLPANVLGKGWNVKIETIDEIERMEEDAFYKGTVVVDNVTWNKTEVKVLKAIASETCQPHSKISNWGIPESEHKILFSSTRALLVYDDPNSPTKVKVVEFLRKREIKCSEMIVACTFNANPVDCSNLFYDVQTDVGGACAANLMPSNLLRKSPTIKTLMDDNKIPNATAEGWEKWKPDVDQFVVVNLTEGDASRKQAVPMVQQKSGQKFGFHFIILFDKLDSKEQRVCQQSDIAGLPFGVQSPITDPELGNSVHLFQPNHIYIVEITPRITTADLDIENIDKLIRGCLMSFEGKLKRYSKYTQINCVRECVAEIIHEECGCSTLNDPKPPGSKLCVSEGDKNCTIKAEAEFYNNHGQKCSHCLPGCAETEYGITVFAIPFDPENPPEVIRKQLKNHPNKLGALVKSYYNLVSFTVINHKHRFSSADKWGIIGGILGLTNAVSAFDFLRAFILAFVALIVPVKMIFGILWWLLKKLKKLITFCCCCCLKKKADEPPPPIDPEIPEPIPIDVIDPNDPPSSPQSERDTEIINLDSDDESMPQPQIDDIPEEPSNPLEPDVQPTDKDRTVNGHFRWIPSCFRRNIVAPTPSQQQDGGESGDGQNQSDDTNSVPVESIDYNQSDDPQKRFWQRTRGILIVQPANRQTQDPEIIEISSEDDSSIPDLVEDLNFHSETIHSNGILSRTFNRIRAAFAFNLRRNVKMENPPEQIVQIGYFRRFWNFIRKLFTCGRQGESSQCRRRASSSIIQPIVETQKVNFCSRMRPNCCRNSDSGVDNPSESIEIENISR